MLGRWLCVVSLTLGASAYRAGAAEEAPPADAKPLLRLEADGPTAYVTGLAFGPNGETLYAAGHDKVVRVWTWDAPASRFVLAPKSYRVPIGAGLEGAINAIALSDDGTWLAVAGMMLSREGTGLRAEGLIVPSLGVTSETMLRHQGTIYLFNTKDPSGHVRLLRGHQGTVVSLAFAPGEPGDKAPALVSAASAQADEGVIRLWDAAEGKSKGGWKLPKISSVRPGLAVKRTGRGHDELEIAIAWGDGSFRVWDVKADTLLPAGDGRPGNNNTVAYRQTRDALITGSVRGPNGHLQSWKSQPGREPSAGALAANFPPHERTYYYPRALALVPGRGNVDRAALVVRGRDLQTDRYGLLLLDLDPQRFGETKANVPLWDFWRAPVLAADPTGRFLAVAGNRDHTIHIYRVTDLLNQQSEPLQRLQSVGASARDLRFVIKDKAYGLFLSDTKLAGADSGDRSLTKGLVFDFTKRRFISDRTGWRVDQPVLRNWLIDVVPAGRDSQGKTLSPPSVRIRAPGQAQPGTIRLRPEEEITSWALLPPGAGSPFAVPLLALAYLEASQPVLRIYDLESGEAVREYTGHQDQIRALSFSADGRLLASAAEDQTVCVWSLTDLKKTWNVRGRLKGIAVDMRNGRLIVADLRAVELAAENRGLLNVGDIVEAVTDGDKPRPLTSAFELYEAVWNRKPGTWITLQAGGKILRLRLSQGIDERKPLLSLFVTHADRAGNREWIGWSPFGYYEAGGRQAEKQLGWHSNTGKVDHPTSFAGIDEYRKDYYREGILHRLVEQGELVASADPPLPAPALTLWLGEAGQEPTRLDGRLLLREPTAMLRLAVDHFPLDKIASLTWQLDEGQAQEFAPGVGRIWSVTLGALPRGTHTLRAVLRTKAAQPKDYGEKLSLLSVPPGPVVDSAALGKHHDVQDKDFILKALVHPGLKGEKVVVHVVHKHADGVDERPVQAPEQIQEFFRLRPGDNVIEVVAVNQDASPAHRELETTRRALLVTYHLKKDPPVISLSRVVTRPKESTKGQTISIEPGKEVEVDVPRVRIEGAIQASEDLAEAKGGLDKAVATLTQFTARTDPKKHTIAEEYDLKPGAQEFRVRARTVAGVETTCVLRLLYRPQLPRVSLKVPPQAQYYEGQDARDIKVEALLTRTADDRPFEAKWLNNGKELADPSRSHVDGKRLTAAISLQDGENRIQIRMSNAWGRAWISNAEALVPHYLRPPGKITLVSPQSELQRPLTDVIVNVESHLPVSAVEGEIGASRLRAINIRPGASASAWIAGFKEVPLTEGDNVLRVWATNRDARSLRPAELTLRYVPPPKPPPRPEVEFLDPRHSAPVSRSRYRIQFQLRSGPLKRAELFQDDERLIQIAPENLKSGVGSHEAKLHPGINRFRLVAVNDGGEGSAEVKLSYVPKPVRVVLDQLELAEQPGRPIRAQVKENSVIVFPTAPGGQAWLHGRILWDDKDDDRFTAPARVNVSVNGVEQAPARLEPHDRKDGQWAFRAAIHLTQRTGNRVLVELPELPGEAGNPKSFRIDCLNPERLRQRLHLLIVGVGDTEEPKLTGRVLNALAATEVKGNRFATPAFAEGFLYKPLIDATYVEPQRVHQELLQIRAKLATRPAGTPSQDVLMVYYLGAESYWSSYMKGLLANLKGSPGLRLLLLDLVDDSMEPAASGVNVDRIAVWTDDPRGGALCYYWKDGKKLKDEGGLAKDFSKAMADAKKLREVADYLKQQFVWHPNEPYGISKKHRDQLIFYPHTPPDLLNLLIATAP